MAASDKDLRHGLSYSLPNHIGVGGDVGGDIGGLVGSNVGGLVGGDEGCGIVILVPLNVMRNPGDRALLQHVRMGF